jgi:hypothetical protein
MPAYDVRFFNPPAPLAGVNLRNPENDQTLADVPMLIDSGADVTLIPQRSVHLLRMQIDPNAGYELMGFDGSKSVARVVNLDLVFLNRVFRGRFLVVNQEWGILGRDVLNHVAVLLDGPRLTWDEQESVRK